MNCFTYGHLVLLLVFLLLPCSTTAAPDPEDTRHKTLIIGRVSSKPKKHIKNLQPIVDYAAARLQDCGITQSKVVFAKNNAQMIEYLRQGKVDWVTETPFSAALFEQAGHSQITLLRWKKGVARYSTLFFTRKDSQVNKLTDLVGRKIAFEDPGSTSAFFLPVSTLLDQGLTVQQLESPRATVDTENVGYIFARGEMNISSWVYLKLVDAGVMSNRDWDEEDRAQPKMRESLRVFYQTANVPRAVELFRTGLDERLQSKLKKILLGMHHDPDGAAALKAYKKTTKFEALTPETTADLDKLRELSVLISDKLQ